MSLAVIFALASTLAAMVILAILVYLWFERLEAEAADAAIECSLARQSNPGRRVQHDPQGAQATGAWAAPARAA